MNKIIECVTTEMAMRVKQKTQLYKKKGVTIIIRESVTCEEGIKITQRSFEYSSL